MKNQLSGWLHYVCIPSTWKSNHHFYRLVSPVLRRTAHAVRVPRRSCPRYRLVSEPPLFYHYFSRGFIIFQKELQFLRWWLTSREFMYIHIYLFLNVYIRTCTTETWNPKERRVSDVFPFFEWVMSSLC